MRKSFTASILAMALAASTIAMPLSANAAEDQFTAAQKNELHNIIREYLLENPQILNEMIEKLQMAERQQQEEQA